jgi:hypothetical protein
MTAADASLHRAADGAGRPPRRSGLPACPVGVNIAQLQLLWVLFSDANSRFNTLIEECAHLQDTVIGLTSDPELLDRIISACPARNTVRGFSRIVCCEPKKSDEYYHVPVRDRAFLSLWTLLGGLIVALDANQRTHEQVYRRTVMALLAGEHAGDDHEMPETPWRDQPELPDADHLFWYVQTRGYFLTEVFRHYTIQVEHAHEMVIQMLENQPGKLPTPILLRRWNSAMYGEFLAEYSRHVNWEAHRLKAMSEGADEPGADGGDLLTKDLSLTHTWTHQPTSMAQLFKVMLKSESAGPEQPHLRSAPHRFATIRSAYFYLEQPILLPLLYHECAHIAFSYRRPPGPTRSPRQGEGGSGTPARDEFMRAREDAVQSLRMVKFPDGRATPRYENFWDHFTEEIWADALAIALGGRAYLVALALQLFGLSGENNFEHFDLEDDTVHELGSLGSATRRMYPEPHPSEEVSFFWEARLMIASSLLELTLPGAGKAPDRPWLDRLAREGDPDAVWVVAIRTLLGGYQRSGAKAHDRHGLSARHEELWRFRRQLNIWVHTTTMRYLREPFRELLPRTPVSSTYVQASPQERECLTRLVHAYRLRHMPEQRPLPGSDPRHFLLDPDARLENLPADIRWLVSADVVGALVQEDLDALRVARIEHPEAALPSGRSQRIASWSTGYANWMRHDGGAAFRIALEASRLRLSLLDALADAIGAYPPRHTWPVGTDGQPRAPDLLAPFHELDPTMCAAMAEDRRTVGRLRRRQITDKPPPQRTPPSLLERLTGWSMQDAPDEIPLVELALQQALKNIDAQVGRAMTRIQRTFVEYGDGEGEALVGTISLGVMRPDEIARAPLTPEMDSPYLASLASVEAQWRTAHQGHMAEATQPISHAYLRKRPMISGAFAPLLGDYQFVTYAKGTTPVERDFHASTAESSFHERFTRRLMKPRMVLQLAGRELSTAIAENRPRHWGRLFLIRFKYRWQWIDLVERLEAGYEHGLKAYSLLSSSAWEDVLLFIWSETQDMVWRAGREYLGLAPGVETGMDIQSSFLPPDNCCGPGCPSTRVTSDGPWEARFHDWARNSKLVERIYSRSGRYDYTVIWKTGHAGHGAEGPREAPDVLGTCMRGLASIPSDLWRHVSSVISSYESLRWPTHGDPAVEGVVPFDAVTHFAVKNRG